LLPGVMKWFTHVMYAVEFITSLSDRIDKYKEIRLISLKII